MRGLDQQVAQVAQQEFSEIQRALRTLPTRLASKRLVILPDKFMATFGGAAAIYGWICICPKLLNAPKHVRQGVIAHEWGHIASGHCLATIGALLVSLVYAANTALLRPSWMIVGLNLSLLALMAGMILWVLQGKREHEADALAAKVVGAEQLSQCLRWVRDEMRNGVESEVMKARLMRLDAAAQEGRTNGQGSHADEYEHPRLGEQASDIRPGAKSRAGTQANLQT